MAETRNGSDANDRGVASSVEMVAKAGRALGQIAQIRETYYETMATAQTADAKQRLAERADGAAVTAISDQGLSQEQYEQVLEAADKDVDVEARLLAAAQLATR